MNRVYQGRLGNFRRNLSLLVCLDGELWVLCCREEGVGHGLAQPSKSLKQGDHLGSHQGSEVACEKGS